MSDGGGRDAAKAADSDGKADGGKTPGAPSGGKKNAAALAAALRANLMRRKAKDRAVKAQEAQAAKDRPAALRDSED